MSETRQETKESRSGDDVQRTVEDTLSDLQTLAGEIRVRMHLAGMDAKDAWNKLEPKLQELEQRAERTTEKASHDLHDMAQDLKKRFKKLRQDIEES